MKPIALLAALGAFVALPAFAQSQSLPPAPPPPGMNDPGVKAVEPPATKKPASTQAINSKAPALPAMQDKSGPRDARGEPPPQVTVRKQGDETIQEFRRSGALYMVVVTPKTGIPQTYMVDANGNYHAQSGPQEPVKPVMYKVMEWGKSKPAEAESTSDGK
ncbi:DUF2782 domain-containing protein [Dyella koreensis]